MHLHIVLAFALLVWWPSEPLFQPLVSGPSATAAIVVGQLAGILVLGRLASAAALRLLHHAPDGGSRGAHLHHWNQNLLRMYAVVSFLADMVLTNWPEMVRSIAPLSAVPGLTDLIILAPFLGATVCVFLATYPMDRAVRELASSEMLWHVPVVRPTWDLKSYLNFNLRHHVLSAAVPMTLILVIYDASRRLEGQIQTVLPFWWAGDALVGLAASIVFLIAPWLLIRIWTTHPLPEGPLRRHLLQRCRGLRFRCRDILVWRSGGVVVNAAVMGLVAPWRYVLLSDALLDTMEAKQIEAVFGHEAGHVRHHHIFYFLLFSVGSMVVASGVMQGLLELSILPQPRFRLGETEIQAAGFVTVVLIWVLGFGAVSRRFERQADLFGARCVTPPIDGECRVPCSVHSFEERMNHPEGLPSESSRSTVAGVPTGPDYAVSARGPLCATGAMVFASALDRVALVNGIPHEENSWRHSSIASRIAFLHRLAADPAELVRFERTVRRIKTVLALVCVVGVAGTTYYIWPDLVRLLSGTTRRVLLLVGTTLVLAN